MAEARRLSGSWMIRCGSSPNRDRKSTRLNSSHLVISYAVFCLKKKKKNLNGTLEMKGIASEQGSRTTVARAERPQALEPVGGVSGLWRYCVLSIVHDVSRYSTV